MSALAVLRVDGRREDVLAGPDLRPLEGRPLLEALAPRRWFGAKGRAPKSIRFRDVIPLSSEVAMTRIEVDLGDGAVAHYQLPLAVVSRMEEASTALARIESPDGEGWLVDAVGDPRFHRHLAAGFERGASSAAGSVEWKIAPLAPAGLDPGSARVGGAEQSNTSIRFGERAIFKLVRRVAPGLNPDVEIGEFLATRTTFRNVPRLLGTVELREAGVEPTIAGMLQAFVRNHGDGWSQALERVRAHEDYSPEARRLGEVTRGLHEALASDANHPEFAPLAVAREHLERWGAKIETQIGRAADLYGTRGSLDTGSAIGKVARLIGAIGEDAGARIRHHGDFHLGQVLPTDGGDFVIIDFEGEPARPLAERRERNSPLRDVAGMLRSFSYAAAAGAGDVPPGDPARRDSWELSAREAFLEGYFSNASARVLPKNRKSTDALISLFELEKAFYELEYELNNRPTWVPIPLAGIERVLGSRRRAT